MFRVDSLIPQPIGEVYCHRHLRNDKFVEHHETEWRRDDGRPYAICGECGKIVFASELSVKEFYGKAVD